jgi:hypothetical protein
MQSVILTSMSVSMTPTSVITKHTNVITTRTSVISTRRVRFLHTECDFTCRLYNNFVMYACEYDNHEYDLYTQSVVSTRIVTLTRTCVISTRRV